MRGLKGKIAAVTGAGSGIGRGGALRLAEEGCKVAVIDWNGPAAEKTAADIKAAGGEAIAITADVSKENEISAAFRKVVDTYKRLDILVSNAGIFSATRDGQVHALDKEVWDEIVGVNLTGMFFGCKRAVQQMLRQEPRNGVRGRIVNITSQHGMISSPDDFAYGVSKAGGVYMTRQIAADYARDLIVCNAVAPGKILTGKPGVAVDPAKLDYARQRTPMPRFGEPSDVANAAPFLASDQATYITGVNLMVDGGWMAA